MVIGIRPLGEVEPDFDQSIDAAVLRYEGRNTGTSRAWMLQEFAKEEWIGDLRNPDTIGELKAGRLQPRKGSTKPYRRCVGHLRVHGYLPS